MKDTEFNELIELTPVGGGFLPANERAEELLSSSATGEILSFQEVTTRDVKFHRAYFSLIHYIYDWLPVTFKKKIPKNKFYIFLKYLRKEFDPVFIFADGTTWNELKSISFGRMSQKTFEQYVKEQLPYIYTEVVCVLYPDKKDSDRIIQCIETEYEKFLIKLK